ncbi:contractile injection system tape measure protein [Flavobacterium coralii]|uniref:contractile injection system tape measure protein n=1 Tax=Flavobacterium coralii TaxID=2838017 RepID=UPI000C6010AF|nr:hypothetical protein [Flavobacterium sp.]|tara:strand:- start:6646 stop:8481 length:1836 start_codon:yes stop_codon:yes gene_type:complete
MHFIRKISIDALSSCEKTGRQLNDEINTVITDELAPKLATLLDKHSADTVVTAIESISISLPPLTIKNWKKEFVSNCLKEIEIFLDRQTAIKEASVAEPKIIFTASNNLSLHKKGIAVSNDYTWKAIIDYLQTGIIENKEFLKIMEEINPLKDDIPTHVTDTLNSILAQDNNTLVRLVLNSPVNFKNTVLTKLIPDYKYSTAIEAVLKSGGISFNSATRQSGWAAVLLSELSFFRSRASTGSKRLKIITDSYFSEIAPKYSEVLSTLIVGNKEIAGSDVRFLKFLELQLSQYHDKQNSSPIQTSPVSEVSKNEIHYDKVYTEKANVATQNKTNSNIQDTAESDLVTKTKNNQFKPETGDDTFGTNEGNTKHVTSSDTVTGNDAVINDNNEKNFVSNKSVSKMDNVGKINNKSITAKSTNPDITPVINIAQTSEQEYIKQKDESMLSTTYINNGGLVLLFPFLSYLFQNTGLTEDNKWISMLQQQKAVLLTQYCVTGNTDFRENELLLNKLLCGYPVFDVVDTTIELSDSDKEQCREMLQSVIQYWEALKNSSPEALQETFLQREAKLSFDNEVIEMWVENKAFDILLQRLPWSIAMVKTVWMEKMIQCNWY